MPESNLNCQHLPNPAALRLVRMMIKSGPPQPFNITLDNDQAREEVEQQLSAEGYSVEVNKKGRLWHLHAAPWKTTLKEAAERKAESQLTAIATSTRTHRTLVVISSDRIGRGDEQMGRQLMLDFIAALPELGNELWRVILLNDAVRMAYFNSPVYSQLQEFESNGVSLMVCKQCIYHFGLQKGVFVGRLAGMGEMVGSSQIADKIIHV